MDFTYPTRIVISNVMNIASRPPSLQANGQIFMEGLTFPSRPDKKTTTLASTLTDNFKVEIVPDTAIAISECLRRIRY